MSEPKALMGDTFKNEGLPTGGVKYLPAEEPKEERRITWTSETTSVKPEYSGQIVVLLNGPPGVGKDTLMEEYKNTHTGVTHCSFKKPMFDIALAASGVSEEEWFKRYDDRDLKEEPWDKLGGLSCRDFMIRISEDWVKPTFGKDHFAKAALAQVKGSGVFLFTDSGFQEEFRTVLEEFGKRHVKLARLYREGLTFEGDSRKYLDPEGCDYMDIFLEEGEITKGISDLEKFIQNNGL